MATRLIPPLIADGGDMTVMRFVASHAFGKISVTLPEGVEAEDSDLDQAYSYKLRGGEVSPFGRRFIRADLDIDAENNVSTVEEVLDDVTNRTAGEALFQQDFTRAALGRLELGVDFNVGDLVPVRRWGRILENQLVTAADDLSTPDDPFGVRVHVGGQLIREPAPLAQRNRDIAREIAQERKERLAQVKAVDAKASDAKSTADDAQNRSKKINLSLTGGEDKLVEEAVAERTGVVGEIAKTADEADALSKLMDLDLNEAVQTVAEGLDIEVPEGKENRMVFSIAQLLALAIQANSRAIKAETDARNLLEREATRMVWADREKAVENADIRLSNPKMSRFTNIVALGTWTGVIVLHTVTRMQEFTGIGVINVDEPWQRHYVVTESNRSFSHDNGAGPAVLHSTVFYQKWAPGKDAVEIENEA